MGNESKKPQRKTSGRRADHRSEPGQHSSNSSPVQSKPQEEADQNTDPLIIVGSRNRLSAAGAKPSRPHHIHNQTGPTPAIPACQSQPTRMRTQSRSNCHCEHPSRVIASGLSVSLRAGYPCHCERSAAISWAQETSCRRRPLTRRFSQSHTECGRATDAVDPEIVLPYYPGIPTLELHYRWRHQDPPQINMHDWRKSCLTTPGGKSLPATRYRERKSCGELPARR